MSASKAFLNWSGGKDATLTLYRVLEAETYCIEGLLTTASEEFGRSSQHGVRMDLVEQQAHHLGLPLHTVWLPPNLSMETYDEYMEEALRALRGQHVEMALFGDIFLEDLRAYREERLAEVGMEGAFPLWQQPTDELALQFLDAGFRAVVVCVDDRRLGREFVGRPYDRAFLESLPADVDPCGEYGEFHTFVYDGPLFRRPVPIETGDIVHRTYDTSQSGAPSHPCGSDERDAPDAGRWFCDLRPAEAPTDPS